MKKLYLTILSIGLVGIIESCGWGNPTPIVYTEYVPVLLSRENLNKSISLKAPNNIVNPAKIYYKDQYIFISERFKGVHIIDNSDPKSPVNKGYVAVPGCVDMAIKNTTLYVDNAVDLIAIDLKEAALGKLAVVKRIENVFPEVSPPDGGVVPSKFNIENRPKNTIIIDWKHQ